MGSAVARDWRSQEMTIHAGSVNRDHVHLLRGIPPQISVSREEEMLGAALVGEGLLGCIEWECDGRSMEGIYQRSEPGRARWWFPRPV